MAIKPLSEARVDEVVKHLGLEDRPAPDLEGLRDVYSRWSTRVPFDNLRKLVALHFDMPELPGIDPADFFAAWLLTGAGGTCWPSNNALHALLVGLGFDARVHGAAMLDMDGVNHGTTIVHLDGAQWLVDSSMLGGAPLPLVEGVEARTEQAGYVVTATPEPAGWLVHFPTPDPSSPMACRLRGEMDADATEEAYEQTRTWSVFNTEVSCTSADADGVWSVRGERVTRIDRHGTSVREVTQVEVDDLLIKEIGHAPQLVAEVRAILDEEPSNLN